MANRRRHSSPLLSPIRISAAFTLFIGLSNTATAETAADSGLGPTHSQFLETSLHQLADSLLAGFTPYRTRPIVLEEPAHDFVDSVFRAQLIEGLSSRGLLIRTDPDTGGSSDAWLATCRLTHSGLTLSEPQRTAFLGTIWLKRAIHPRAGLKIEDPVDSTIVWEQEVDTVYTDWIRKRDVEKLSDLGDPRYRPVSPATGWEKAALPLATGASAVFLGVLFLVLR